MLQRGLAMAAAGASANLLGPGAALAAPRRRPAPLGATDATRVNPRQFTPLGKLRDWQDALDDVGLRATGSSVHDRYVASLADRLERVGVKNVRTEPVPLKRWEPGRFGLEVVGGGAPGAAPMAPGPVPVASYVPYSGRTPAAGVTGTLSLTPAPGSIVLFDVPPVPLATGVFDALDYGSPHHPAGYSPATVYDRAWVSQIPLVNVLNNLSSAAAGGAGPAGAIAILDLPAHAAQGMYMPYDGVLRDIPAVFVDRDVGAKLKQVAAAGGTVRLTLEADVRSVTTPNLLGVIPGRSDELVILQSHHDGTNGIEENGPEAILAMAQYLARIPRRRLPRTILILLSTGHFAGDALGTTTFCTAHKDDLIKRTAAAVTIEHLGALEWLAGPDGNFRLTGNAEFGGMFASPVPAFVDPARVALQRARVTEDRVMRPWSPDQRAPDGLRWPGDGMPFWAVSGLPAGNFITGPAYLLNYGIPMRDKIDIAAMRRQAIAFTDLVLKLGRVPLAQLQTRSPG
jgi:hypothetical protein